VRPVSFPAVPETRQPFWLIQRGAPPGNLPVVDASQFFGVISRELATIRANSFSGLSRIDAMSLLGRFLKTEPKATGGEYGGRAKIDSTREGPSIQTATLADLGLRKKESLQAQLPRSGDPLIPSAGNHFW
jgi:hypothetical protein